MSNKCRKCRINMRWASAPGRYYRIDGVNVEIPAAWFVPQCPKCGRISLSIRELHELERIANRESTDADV